MDRGAWWAIVIGLQRVRRTEHTHTHLFEYSQNSDENNQIEID